jgi:hypothetical protein
LAPNSITLGSVSPSTTTETVRLGASRPYWERSSVVSATTSCASRRSTLPSIPSTAELSAGAAKGAVTFHAPSSFTSRIVSCPVAARVISRVFSLSTVRIASFFSSSPGSRLRSTNQM